MIREMKKEISLRKSADTIFLYSNIKNIIIFWLKGGREDFIVLIINQAWEIKTEIQLQIK